jgi:hypothetical protein
MSLATSQMSFGTSMKVRETHIRIVRATYVLVSSKVGLADLQKLLRRHMTVCLAAF